MTNNEKYNLETIASECNMLVSIGGDGTILSTLRKHE